MTEQRSSRFFGYYDSPYQPIDKPSYDPGWENTPCLFCMNPLTLDTLRTVSIMAIPNNAKVIPRGDGTAELLLGAPPQGQRSYFYRVHRACDDAINADEKALYESAAIDIPKV